VTIDKDGVISEPLAGTPAIVAAPLAAMYDVRLDKDFAKNRTLYFSYVTKVDGDGKQGVGRVVRAKLSKDDKTLTDLTVIHEMVDLLPRRIIWAPDNTLFVTAGEVNSGGPAMQSLQAERGKVLRINTDGSIPKDNPFLKTPGADPALYAVGFRDQEAAQINPATGELWTAEDEPEGGDELNVIKAGHNYGFPVISYGRDNNGSLINHGLTAQDGMDQPVYFWTPSIAPSGMTFYTGKALPGWTGSVFIGALSGQQLVRLEMKNGRVVGEEKLLRDRCERIRDVRQGPDGLIYLITDQADGKVLRLVPTK
jgi:glucose/arabinose dehydrogenase